MKIKKHKCCMCGETATWYKVIHEKGDSLYYCDKCIPRKSLSNVCNLEEDGEPYEGTDVMWWNENCVVRDFNVDGSKTRTSDSFFYEYLDEKGQRKPSTKFLYSLDGFEKKNEEPLISHTDIYKAYSNTKDILPTYQAKTIGTLIADILIDYNGFDGSQGIPYNLFMSKMGDEIKDRLPLIMHKNNLHKFYQEFKKILSALKHTTNKTVKKCYTNEYVY